MIQNMTEGKPIRLMLRFSLPMLLANILHLLYTVADSAVLGRMLGVDAFASVGATASLYWLVLSAVFAFTQGFGIVFAQRFGADDMDGLRRAFVTAVYLAAVFGVLIGLLGTFGCVPVLRLLNTPPELLDSAAVYIKLLLGGMTISLMYNILSGLLRALGDSKTPLYAMIFTTALNIALDVALAIPFGVIGVAIATLLSQAAASVLCFRALKKTGIVKDCGYRPDKASVVPLLRLGIPLCLRNAVIEVGGLAVQRYTNGYGAEFIAGIAAAKRMYSLLMIAGGAIEASVATFVAQNFGAKRYDRVKQGVKNGFGLMLVSSAVIMAVVLLFGQQILGLLVEGEATRITEMLDVGARQLTVMALGLPLVYLLFLYRAALQGIGNAFIPMLSGFAELIMRLISVILLTPVWGEWGVYLSDPLGWPPAAVLLITAYYIYYKKVRKQNEKTDIKRVVDAENA